MLYEDRDESIHFPPLFNFEVDKRILSKNKQIFKNEIGAADDLKK